MNSSNKIATPGQRVGAIRQIINGSIEIYGYGTFEGKFIPPIEVDMVSHILNRPIPKIKLDNGETIWGNKCWWSDEKRVQSLVSTFANVRIIKPVEIAAKV